jgi:hypothetical protein
MWSVKREKSVSVGVWYLLLSGIILRVFRSEGGRYAWNIYELSVRLAKRIFFKILSDFFCYIKDDLDNLKIIFKRYLSIFSAFLQKTNVVCPSVGCALPLIFVSLSVQQGWECVGWRQLTIDTDASINTTDKKFDKKFETSVIFINAFKTLQHKYFYVFVIGNVKTR